MGIHENFNICRGKILDFNYASSWVERIRFIGLADLKNKVQIIAKFPKSIPVM